MIDEIIIDNNRIVPGQQSLLQLSVAQLPSGTDIHLNVHVYRSRRKGPKVLVLGGLHGDEVNGVEIVRRSIVDELFEGLQMGSVIAIPLLNIYGFINFSRDLPDGKDVNRSFPGSRNGSLASRVARTLTEHILPYIDFGIDFHTGGNSRYNYPQIRFTEGDEQAEKLAKLFAAPYLIRNKAIDRSLRKEAQKRGIPMLVYEGGESLRLDTFSIEEGLAGLKRILYAKGMIADPPMPSHKSQLFTKSSWIRSPRSGMFLWKVNSGQEVKEGDELGWVHDPDGQEEVPILANRNGFIIGHNNAPVINQGDALFHIGYQEI